MAGRARLYTIPLSHPGEAARLALVRAGVEHDVVELIGGTHPLQLYALGFRGRTVPALRLGDGERLQGSLEITGWAHDRAPGAGLYPSDPAAAAKVEEAERWGERELQPLARRFIRWSLSHHYRVRRWFAATASPFPLPAVTGAVLTPLAPLFLRLAGGSDEQVRLDLEALPGRLEHVERLLSEGVLGGEPANAADLQIATSLNALLAFEDLGPVLAGAPEEYATAVVPERLPTIPAALPAAWIAPAHG